jgi:hypothetical protein
MDEVAVIRYYDLSPFAQRLTSVPSCVIKSHDNDVVNPHAEDCRRAIIQGDKTTRDVERCQFCINLTSADELLAKVQWEDDVV